MAEPLRLVLASASPRRLDLLRLVGADPEVRPADIDERPHPDEDPVAYVCRLADEKAKAVACAEDEVVLAADTTVVLDGRILGKPDDPAHAADMLRALSGHTHTVSTGVAARNAAGTTQTVLVTTAVTFADLSQQQIDAYVATGEPLGKAGGYGIQGDAAAFVERLDGSWTNVVGLPLVETARLVRTHGIDLGLA